MGCTCKKRRSVLCKTIGNVTVSLFLGYFCFTSNIHDRNFFSIVFHVDSCQIFLAVMVVFVILIAKFAGFSFVLFSNKYFFNSHLLTLFFSFSVRLVG